MHPNPEFFQPTHARSCEAKLVSDKVLWHKERLSTYWVRTITSVDEKRASFYIIAKSFTLSHILCPDACCQAIFAVVHQFDSLFVTIDFHDRNNGTKSFFSHNLHVVVNICQETRGDVAASGRQTLKCGILRGGIDRTVAQGIFYLRRDGLNSRSGDDWPDGCGLVGRIANLVTTKR